MTYFKAKTIDENAVELVYKCNQCGEFYDLHNYGVYGSELLKKLRCEVKQEWDDYDRKSYIDDIVMSILPQEFSDEQKRAIISLCPSCRRRKYIVPLFSVRHIDVPCCGSCVHFHRRGRKSKGVWAFCDKMTEKNVSVFPHNALTEDCVCNFHEPSQEIRSISLIDNEHGSTGR